MEKDNINPAHYRQQPYECIEFTENMNFNMGNAFKYIWRYRDKRRFGTWSASAMTRRSLRN